MDVVVMGGGVAGVAAAVSAAQHGARVTLLERSHHVGGVAVIGGHRSLCGLAAIDATVPDLLEPTLTATWVPRLTVGEPQRHGRVWLWPTRPDALVAGLRAGLASAGVEVRYSQSFSIDATGQVLGSGALMRPHAIIDATGTANGPGPRRATRQLGAWRMEITAVIEDSPRGRRAALRSIAELAPGAALTYLGEARWQLSLDLPSQDMALLNAIGEAAATALCGQLITVQRSLAHRDDGGYDGISLASLFSHDEHGLAWAAWPSEMHTSTGVHWVWPPRSRHGLPRSLIKPAGAPEWLWCCGKGLAAAPEAAGALRVTGTALALGSALGHLVTTT